MNKRHSKKEEGRYYNYISENACKCEKEIFGNKYN